MSDDLEYLVWPAVNSLPPNWRYFGRGGTESALRAYLDEVMVDTIPAPLEVDCERNLGRLLSVEEK